MYRSGLRLLAQAQAPRGASFVSSTRAALRAFHASPAVLVKVGDKIPDVELMEGSPGNKVSIAQDLKGKGLIIGVPAAFSPACSETHIPGYINFKGLKDAGQVYVVSVNDPFVMKAWAASLDAEGKSGVSWTADDNLMCPALT
jgi:peroxiredoxin 5